MKIRNQASIIKRVEAIRKGVDIRILYSREVIKRGTDNLFIDIIRDFKQRRSENEK